MMRNARNRGAHAGEGPGGRRCTCCRIKPNTNFRAAENRQWRKDEGMPA
ncbi:hypothetical protein [Gordonia otitidis]|nr:hypothetical protein [Gordonia otitidis]